MKLEEKVILLSGSMSSTMDVLQEAVVLTDSSGRIHYANAAFLGLVGASNQQEPLGRNLFLSYPFEVPEQKIMLLENAIATGQSVVSSRVKYGSKGNGKYVNIKITPLEERDGAKVGMSDITKEMSEIMYDGLTGAYSQSHYVRKLRNAIIDDARSRNSYLGIIGVDLKGLKRVNDSVGKKVGDIMLINLADILLQVIRDSGYVVRDGGDEFIILCPNATPERIEELMGSINSTSLIYNKLIQDPREQINLYMVGKADNSNFMEMFSYIEQKINAQKGTSR